MGCRRRTSSVWDSAFLRPRAFRLFLRTFEGDLYEEIRRGELPYLANYSKRFNNMLSSMISIRPHDRPSAIKLLKQISVMNMKTESQLSRELKASQKRLEELQKAILQSY